MKNDVYRITVEGSGDFPWDMLRYDSCYPETSSDAMKLPRPAERPTRRVVNLIKHQYPPTAARWESFGWGCSFEVLR